MAMPGATSSFFVTSNALRYYSSFLYIILYVVFLLQVEVGVFFLTLPDVRLDRPDLGESNCTMKTVHLRTSSAFFFGLCR